MSGSKRTVLASVVRRITRRTICWLAALSFLAGIVRGAASDLGEFEGDLARLKTFYSGPQNGEESNHYIDMWDAGRVRSLTTYAGLTNNRALFINSHGKGFRGRHSSGYAYYPHQSLVQDQDQMYSAKDLAAVVGPAASQIHNIIVAGCDLDRSFDTAALRRYFPNATNITHSVSGEAGYQPMYVQALLSPSQHIEPLYETATLTPQGQTQYEISPKSSPKAKKLTPYVAELFKPGARKPFRTQIAGRELIDPTPGAVTLTATAKP